MLRRFVLAKYNRMNTKLKTIENRKPNGHKANTSKPRRSPVPIARICVRKTRLNRMTYEKNTTGTNNNGAREYKLPEDSKEKP